MHTLRTVTNKLRDTPTVRVRCQPYRVRIGSLFSGYGGLDLAVQHALGGQVAWHVEYDKAPSRILHHHYPGIPNHGDVTKLDFTSVEPVDVLTGGYPCQPFSHAGLRKGTDDDRHLWPHVLRAISEMGPRLVILENVRGHLSMGFDTVLADLASVGWSAEWAIVRASDVGACHQRARLFIVAYPAHLGHEWIGQARRRRPGPTDSGDNAADAAGARDGWSRNPKRGSVGRVTAAGTGQDLPADAGGERYGRGQDAGMVGRLGATAESGGRQASAARSQSGHRGPADAADADDWQQQINQSHDSILRRGPVVTAGARGDGVDTVGALAGSHAARGSVAPCDCGSAADADLSGSQARGDTRHDSERLRVQPVGLAQPPTNADHTGSQGRQSAGRRDLFAWGDYGPAITRWERVIGRPAPAPTEPGRTGAPRLSPAFVEWMMGLPDGWVTDPAIGISRNDQLKALGNGVVPQQAAMAITALLARCH